MSKDQDSYTYRLAQRQSMLDGGLNPYPQDGYRNCTNMQAKDLEHGEEVIVAGRIMRMRGHGKIRFLDIEDESGTIQIVVKSEDLDNFENITNFGLSDFIRVKGRRGVTKAGEESVFAQDFNMLSKALRQLPDGWGNNRLRNEEMRYRYRSVDLALSSEQREIFRRRSLIVSAVRNTLDYHGFMEVETPTLQPLYGGANARPFVTHINAWDMPMYLRISPELYLKYLVMGGYDRVFEITKNFRNEGVDRTHNPEFTMMECYAAYTDYKDMMILTELIYENAARAVNKGSSIVNYQGVEIDFSQPWQRLTMKAAISQYLHIDVDSLGDDELKNVISEWGLDYNGKWIRGLGVAKLFEAVEDKLIQPTFIIDFPRETTTLCKPHRDDPSLIERFEPYICGSEVGNAYTELNDPILQRQYWEEERQDDPEAHPLDENFIYSMEYGMPPTGGLGLGIDRMVMILTDKPRIRDVILFPTMKPKK